jgi:hypothetical protein
MRFANDDGRLTLIARGSDDELDGATGIDVHAASGGQIPADPDPDPGAATRRRTRGASG